MTDRIDDCLHILRRILRTTERAERTMAQAAGLTAAQLRVLQIVSAAPSRAATPTALAQHMRVSQATVTALVDKLAAQELVLRQRSETDRRQTNVRITPAGQAAVAAAPDPLIGRLRTSFPNIAEWEQAMILAGLERLSALLAADGADTVDEADPGSVRVASSR